ncbi:MAG TPA: tyrosine-type recombinase/integrase [Dehalococcoidales bacterium]|nr:tyrosine-type recombinase/integrase [Dehalococcoidales bacterium]
MKAYLEPDEVAMMEKAASNLRDRLLIRLLFHLGCRISEALAVTVEDIDLANGTVTIQHLKTRLNLSCPKCNTKLGKSHTFCPKCGVEVKEAVAKELEHRRVRTLPLDRNTLGMLHGYIKRGGPVKREDKNLIFGINRHRAWQIIKECAEKASLGSDVNSGHQSPHPASTNLA